MSTFSWNFIPGCVALAFILVKTIKGDECTLYLADSAIEGAGLGIYTGVDVRKHELVTRKLGDELCFASFRYEATLLSEYSWYPSHVGMAYEIGNLDKTVPVCPGLAMLCNDFVTKDNIELTQISSTSSIDRESPLTGSFTYYSNLHLQTTKNIPAGSELYLSYGGEYFSTRETLKSIVPTQKDISTVYHLSRNLLAFTDKHLQTGDEKDLKKLEKIISWLKQKALPLSFPDNPPISNVLPSDKQGLLQFISTDETKQQKPLSWLQNNGYCLDQLQARTNDKGKGAYANNAFSKGDIVAPVPLLQLDRHKVDSYLIEKDGENSTAFRRSLMINYCYSHPESSLLLLPYTSSPNFVNHDLHYANVQLQWVDSKNAKTSFHHPEWLDLSVSELLKTKSKAGLMMELVAIRDIKPGDEILLNYGEQWQKAWDDHVQKWTIPEGTKEYIPASKITEATYPTLYTKEEHNDYPSNLMTACYINWKRPYAFYEEAMEEGSDSSAVFTEVWEEYYDTFSYQYNLRPCEILQKEKDKNGEILYTVQVYNGFSEEDTDSLLETGETLIFTHVPRRAITFVDRPYTTDQHLLNAFRHPIIIPDEIFPMSWKDRPKQSFSMLNGNKKDEL